MTVSRRVMGWLFGNLWLKLLSLGLALLLWMVVSGEATVERGLRVPLELTQVPAASSCSATCRLPSTSGFAEGRGPSAESAPATWSRSSICTPRNRAAACSR